jgi:hypothetical protein
MPANIDKHHAFAEMLDEIIRQTTSLSLRVTPSIADKDSVQLPLPLGEHGDPAARTGVDYHDWTKSTPLTGTRGIACLAPATLLVVRSETYPETGFAEITVVATASNEVISILAFLAWTNLNPMRGMVSWIGLKQVPLRYERHPRFAGKTKYPLHKMVRFAIDAITSFSVLPLRIASYCGVLSGITTFVLLGYALYSWVSGRTVPGWTSLMLIVLSIGTVQLLSLGVFGDYLGRLYMEANSALY